MRKINIQLVMLMMTLLSALSLQGQINPLGSQYFQNRYLANPAMAGVEGGLNLNIGYRNQWQKMPGSPESGSMTVDYRVKKVGLGASFFKEKAGLLTNNNFKGTFSYHMPVSGSGDELHFGISVGLSNDRLDNGGIVGNSSDPLAAQFNDIGMDFQGDFGIAYTTDKLTIEGAWNNLRDRLQDDRREDVNYNTFYTSLSYEFELLDWKFYPKAVYRGVNNYKNILDIGGEIKTGKEDLGLLGMYHTNKSFSLGISYEHKKQWEFMFFYNDPTAVLESYSNGSFELGLRVKLEKRKK
ncbi:PorP/SprF family type IX secretion system membrane protein [Pedobacter puniceum]|nr:PorP/SprF family type IX secretion system membrane protein [Pedobacter puniceum]